MPGVGVGIGVGGGSVLVGSGAGSGMHPDSSMPVMISSKILFLINPPLSDTRDPFKGYCKLPAVK
jgi:hypothetical protein